MSECSLTSAKLQNMRKARDFLRAHDQRQQKGLSLKEEVGQMVFGCPTSSNNCNVDSFTICTAAVSLIRLREFLVVT